MPVVTNSKWYILSPIIKKKKTGIKLPHKYIFLFIKSSDTHICFGTISRKAESPHHVSGIFFPFQAGVIITINCFYLLQSELPKMWQPCYCIKIRCCFFLDKWITVRAIILSPFDHCLLKSVQSSLLGYLNTFLIFNQ